MNLLLYEWSEDVFSNGSLVVPQSFICQLSLSRWFRTPLCMLSHFSRVQLFAALRTVARQTPPSMGLPRQEYWGGQPFPSPDGDLPHPGIRPASPELQVDCLPLSRQGSP